MFKKSGFTLVELLVVISIISVLSMIGAAVYSGVQKNAGISATREELRRLQDVMLVYRTRNRELPPVGDSCPSCDAGRGPGDSANVVRADRMRTGPVAALAAPSRGGPYIANPEDFVYDAWGQAYYYDDNDANIPPRSTKPCQCYTEGAWCYNSESHLFSSGPDKIPFNGDDISYVISCP